MRVSNHTKDDCLLTMISCPYAGMGCTTKVKNYISQAQGSAPCTLQPYIPSWLASYLILSRRILEASVLLYKIFPAATNHRWQRSPNLPISLVNSTSLSWNDYFWCVTRSHFFTIYERDPIELQWYWHKSKKRSKTTLLLLVNPETYPTNAWS